MDCIWGPSSNPPVFTCWRGQKKGEAHTHSQTDRRAKQKQKGAQRQRGPAAHASSATCRWLSLFTPLDCTTSKQTWKARRVRCRASRQPSCKTQFPCKACEPQGRGQCAERAETVRRKGGAGVCLSFISQHNTHKRLLTHTERTPHHTSNSTCLASVRTPLGPPQRRRAALRSARDRRWGRKRYVCSTMPLFPGGA
jgi:hypothetical protein